MTSDPSSSQPAPAPSHIKLFRPYISPADVDRLSAKQRGKLSVSREERARQQACGFIDAVGVRCGFPRRTIATAQTLYMRFHLFFPYKDFAFTEVALSTLYVSSKLHDTLKKPREIIQASLPLRFPHLLKKGAVALDLKSLDPAMLEAERRRVLSIERLVLESLCFKFGAVAGLDDVIALGKRLGLSRSVVEVAWRLAVDCYRTPAPLSFPPHTIALGSMYTAALLSLESTSPACSSLSSTSSGEHDVGALPGHAPPSEQFQRLVDMLGNAGAWEAEYSATAENIDDIAHAVLDLYLTILSLPAASSLDSSTGTGTGLSSMSGPSPISPRETSSPGHLHSNPSLNASLNANPNVSLNPNPNVSLNHNAANAAYASDQRTQMAFLLSGYWTTQSLTELKIWLRNRRPPRPTPLGHAPGRPQALSWPTVELIGNGTGGVDGRQGIDGAEGADGAEGGQAGGRHEKGGERAKTDELDTAVEGLGKNEGTVRFLWEPEQVGM